MTGRMVPDTIKPHTHPSLLDQAGLDSHISSLTLETSLSACPCAWGPHGSRGIGCSHMASRGTERETQILLHDHTAPEPGLWGLVLRAQKGGGGAPGSHGAQHSDLKLGTSFA